MGWYEFTRSQIALRKKRQQLSSACGRTQKTEDGGLPPKPPFLKRSNMVDAASPVSQVSMFCQAVISNALPHRLWGLGTDGKRNREIILKHVDTFVRLRRFESLSLHVVSQHLKVGYVFE